MCTMYDTMPRWMWTMGERDSLLSFSLGGRFAHALPFDPSQPSVKPPSHRSPSDVSFPPPSHSHSPSHSRPRPTEGEPRCPFARRPACTLLTSKEQPDPLPSQPHPLSSLCSPLPPPLACLQQRTPELLLPLLAPSFPPSLSSSLAFPPPVPSLPHIRALFDLRSLAPLDLRSP